MAGVRAKTSGADHNVMRELNRSLVLDLLKKHSPISRATIAKSTDLAKPTVSAIIDELIQKGVVREIGIGETTTGGGRPPIMLEFNARSQFVAGVQIGVRRVHVLVADASGVEIGRLEEPTPKKKPDEILRMVAKLVRRALADAEVPKARLAAVGVCVPGLIDFDSGVCVLAPNLKWRDVAVGATLRKALGVPVFVHNAAQAAVVAESIAGAGKGVDDIVFLYAGSGIGAAILSNGRLFHGSGGIAGEVGHCPIPGATKLCNCGKVGCLETVSSGPAIADAARQGLRAGTRSVLSDMPASRITAEDVSRAAAEGDPLAVEVMSVAAQALGVGVAWMVNLFNPSMVVVGGGIAGAGEVLIGQLRDTLRTQALPQAVDHLQVVGSTLGDDAEMRGAVLVALQYSEQFFRVIFQG